MTFSSNPQPSNWGLRILIGSNLNSLIFNPQPTIINPQSAVPASTAASWCRSGSMEANFRPGCTWSRIAGLGVSENYPVGSGAENPSKHKPESEGWRGGIPEKRYFTVFLDCIWPVVYVFVQFRWCL